MTNAVCLVESYEGSEHVWALSWEHEMCLEQFICLDVN